ncbi:Narbonolide/10-deoxymethynolide synthase PikA1 [Durusdinium trenchii]|uniref:Modules 1 and 2 (Narbonolide/10-deoxymethynolide synthase PikAI) (Pikromycin polyketide synthase component PikAI) (Pikromycin PKS component PikAI) (Type I modular polyketide synthase PikAI) (PKS) n=1 Tax=Durusdinium trenchii TaxID=1381693 RepID=A0ABP0RFF9_9DINO
MRRNPDEISCRMKLNSDVPNQGYIIHPSLFDGTIHAVCATMFDQDPPFLKIFAGVGKVTVVTKEAPKDEAVILHLSITEKTDQQQIFTCQVFTEQGALLWRLEDVIFRKARSSSGALGAGVAQAAQLARPGLISHDTVNAVQLPVNDSMKDAVSYFETSWKAFGELGDAGEEHGLLPLTAEGKWLFQGEDALLKALKSDLGDHHGFVSPGKEEDLSGFDRVIYMPSKETPMEALCQGLKLIQKAQRADPAPEVWFVLRGTQAVRAEELKGQAVPLFAGLWGLARCLRLEVPNAVCGCVDLGPLPKDVKATELLKRLQSLETRRQGKDGLATLDEAIGGREVEPEVLIGDGLLVSRLEETTPKFQEIDLENYRLEDGSYGLTGGTGGLGLLFGAFFAEKGATHLGLISRSGKVAQDPASQSTYQRLLDTKAQISLKACDSAQAEAVTACLKELNAEKPLKGLLHAAGVLDDHLIMDLEAQHFTPVLNPKIDGTLWGDPEVKSTAAFLPSGVVYKIVKNLHNALKKLGLEGDGKAGWDWTRRGLGKIQRKEACNFVHNFAGAL